jgi:protein TonB
VIYRSQPGTQASDAAPGTLIRRVEPQYPADAKTRHIQGPVVLDVQVLSDGTVGTVGVVSGNPSLTEAAVHAVRQWKYQPNVMNGRTVEGQTRVTINFTLPTAN